MNNNMGAEGTRPGYVYWVTGLAGAGKTTIGRILYEKLRKKCVNVIFLDGDILRNVFQDMGGFSAADRRMYASAYGRLCKMLSDQGMNVVCCTVSMFDEVRRWNRDNISFYREIFLDVPLEVLKKRDQKGLYSRAVRGEVKDVVGVDLNLELPRYPDVRIENDGSLSPEQTVDMIWDSLLQKGRGLSDESGNVHSDTGR